MQLERHPTAAARRPDALAAMPLGEQSKEMKQAKRTDGVVSLAAVILSFLATQHHNLHMLLFAIGISSAGMSLMTIFPVIRHIMLLMSLAMVGLMVYRARDAKRSTSMRVVNVVSVALTLGLMGWSVSQFGL